MIRRTVVTLAMTALLLVALAGQTLAVPTHLHCLTTPSGHVHSIAGGVTYQAPHETLHNFHSNVHFGAFVGHPLGPLSADASEPLTCPPS